MLKKNIKALLATTALASFGLLAGCGSTPLPPDTGCGVPGGLCAPAAPSASPLPSEPGYTPPAPVEPARTSPVELPPPSDGRPLAADVLPRAGVRIALLLPLQSGSLAQPAEAVRAAGLNVVPLPGPSAAITALSASGLVNDRFHFVGFLPAKPKQRESALALLAREASTLVIYEAPHRIVECVEGLVATFEPTRQVVFARELSKMFEEIHRCELKEALAWVKADQHRERGEFVVLVEGAVAETDAQDAEAERILQILLTECSVKQAASLAAQITGRKKNALYDRALHIKEGQS